MRDLMTTREVADYLRIRERKVYALVRGKRIPCTRVTGKWLFPRAMIDLWVLRNSGAADDTATRTETPAVVAGSHDPLLEWAVRESGSELAMLFDGSLDGVRRVLSGQACVCGLHVIDPQDGGYNRHVIAQNPARSTAVLLQWAWREQGLMTAAGNPLQLASLADALHRRVRFADRQAGSGSHLLLEHLLAQGGARVEQLRRIAPPARTERDAALAVADGNADAALGVAAEARRYRLGFIPLHRERYDLLFHRRDYFEPPLQALLQFTRTPGFAAKAHDLGGYDIGALGNVMYNAP
ncbi:MAG TPA: helix-turn-helix transcriptional regulator [Rhodanobacteraceae bacterium]